MKWYRLAALQGNAVAQVSLAVALADGRGTPRNEGEAISWYRRAAEQGIPEAQLGLGAMLSTGRGVARDDAEAARWYRLAAEQGQAMAQASLGASYLYGRGVEKDLVLADVWLTRSAAGGFDKVKPVLDQLDKRLARRARAPAAARATRRTGALIRSAHAAVVWLPNRGWISSHPDAPAGSA